MSKTKALVVGVSDYNISGASDLPFCMNDVIEVRNALLSGLKLDNEDITTLGEFGNVTTSDFRSAIAQTASLTFENDTLIFYFSGHGAKINNQHYLVFSNGVVSTQEIIEFFGKSEVKGKIVFLDCCYSGEFSVAGTSSLSIEKTVEDFAGEGYAVFSSSNSNQVSYGHPDRPISVFTSFLCDAFRDKYIIRQGIVSLYDIQKLVRLYLEVWNRRNPDKQQHPIFRADMGGTINFKVQAYVPYYPKRIYEECDNYVIYNVKPTHAGMAKRYSVEVILKEPLSLNEISKISLEITQKIRGVEVYDNIIAEKRLSGKLANIIWIYFGRDESDMVKKIFLLNTTWVDGAQDKKWWYRVNNEDTFMQNNVHFKIFPFYEQLRRLNIENTGSELKVIYETKEIVASMITLAERSIYFFNEYVNDELTEEGLMDEMEQVIPDIEGCFFKSTDLDFPPDNLSEWSVACSGVFGTIHDFTYYYNKKYVEQRSPENRRACMEMTIKQYYVDLERVRKLEKQLRL